MPKIKLPFLNDGAEFNVHVLIEDIERYELAEDKLEEEAYQKARTAKRPFKGLSPSKLLRTREEWLQSIRSKSPDWKGDKPKEASQIHAAFWAIWRVTALGGPADPLE